MIAEENEGRPGMRILHVAQPIDGGVAGVVMDLVEDQIGRGWRPVVACPERGRLSDALAEMGAEHRSWEATRSPGPATVPETAALRRIVRDTRPDAVHLHGSKAGLAGRLAVRGSIPTVFQPHLWSFQSDRGPAGRAAVIWERIAARWTDLFVCVSGDEWRDGRAAHIGGRMVVVANGVDVSGLVPVDNAGVKPQMGFGPEPLVVCVGRLAPLKGQDVLLDAWPAVQCVMPHAQLVFVGDGPQGEQLRAHPVAADPSVHWLGNRDDAHRYLAAADVVVVPSRAEGMALVPLEAMSLGRSLVASDVGGIRQSVGEAGAVVPPEDVQALTTEIIRRLIDDELRSREGILARARAEKFFDRRRVGEEIATLCAALVTEVSSDV
ncbi:putative glycosyl transferase, group 1 [Gordonia polyisoprenivorans VH2]|uniref:Putative glycosyl transferase, group 1 n=2 Tax=Gordonia polyisoprenivorans TaxID=84595 RepID=H6N1J0_GORPV|nr:putative glycosyl transferase, group 1 [Gordonia polyisoprenivorans VH2]OZC29157.1 glycosyltransferase family 1 protein [Gordonia polyisoprenivorans]QUD81682.1 glycosyltransferase [Gordonia polyisoprenivorans]